jgi:hypothetical protein
MSADQKIIFYSTAISLILTYAWWVHFRVWILRQDLFAIRDRLWDTMRAKGQLESVAHRETRNGINAMIRFAPYLSLVTVAIILTSGVESKCENVELPAEIVDFRKAVFLRVLRFLVCETLTGWLFGAGAIIVFSQHLARTQMQKWISRIFDSIDVRDMELPTGHTDILGA